MAGAEAGRAAAALALVVNAFVWGVSWWPFRQLQAHGLHPLWATAGVYLVSLAVLLLVRPGAWRGFAGQPQLWLLMAAAGLTNVGFNWAVTVGDVVRVVLLFYLMPAWSVLLAWPLLGERPSGPALLRLALALAGLAVILKTPETPWPVPQGLPDLLALLGGFSFALTNILLRRLQAAPAVTRVGAMFTGGALAATLAGLAGMGQGLVGAPVVLPPSAIAIGALLSLAFLAGNAALQFGASRLPAQTTSLVMLSEVLFASASSVLLGAAQLAPRTWVGGALVVAAAVWSAWAAPGAPAVKRTQSAA
ncbi:MAG TPA: DMT family transporter [Ramlibacter sp.]|jgi:drug/metabolite transporter (DMT)-like permease|uniref:DMT family transporter n=1 Tax=Ramlibacter sp. TaxID=1917967 RepID=UPI002D3C5C5D|nr:DMT family transporter [Ramlibacter sp.]HZY17348.1 DMT family transporter [Ramlibacter sp.]